MISNFLFKAEGQELIDFLNEAIYIFYIKLEILGQIPNFFLCIYFFPLTWNNLCHLLSFLCICLCII